MPGDREKLQQRCDRLKRETSAGGYFLNPDTEFVLDLVDGLMVNEERYGYPSCPCRLATGDRTEDRDIICPCDYRDPDILEHNACYCALYVSRAAAAGEVKVVPIVERRPPREERAQFKPRESGAAFSGLPYPVWRCRVCGYLCAREEPPEICPVCKAGKDRFERFV